MADESERPIVKSDERAAQAEKSPNTFFILATSLVALTVIAIALFWYFGVFDGMGGAGRKA